MVHNKFNFSGQYGRDQFKKFIGQSEIQGLVGSLGHTISQEYENQELVVVGVLKGSFMFMADLVREIKNVKVTTDFLKASSIGRDDTSDGTIQIEKDLSENIRGKHTLLVEQIIDTARTAQFLREHLAKSQPKSLKLLTLFDKPCKRKIDFSPDYVGKRIEDLFIVGYGLDVEGFGRNSTDLYFLKYPN